MSVVAENTRRIIRERGMRQKDAADRANIPEKLFSSMMCGRKVIREADVLSIARALDVTPNELFGITENPPG